MGIKNPGKSGLISGILRDCGAGRNRTAVQTSAQYAFYRFIRGIRISENGRSRTNLPVSQLLFLSGAPQRAHNRCFVGVMGGGGVQSQNACGGPMAYASSLGIRQPWHTEYCHLGFGSSDLRANNPTHDLLTYPAPCCQNRSAPVIFRQKTVAERQKTIGLWEKILFSKNCLRIYDFFRKLRIFPSAVQEPEVHFLPVFRIFFVLHGFLLRFLQLLVYFFKNFFL